MQTKTCSQDVSKTPGPLKKPLNYSRKVLDSEMRNRHYDHAVGEVEHTALVKSHLI